jgi:hypothetical protein
MLFQTMGIIKEVEKFQQKEDQDASRIKPASIQRQKEIFNKIPFTSAPTPDRSRKALTLYTRHGEPPDSYDPLRTTYLQTPRNDNGFLSPVRSSASSKPPWNYS